MRYGLFLTGRGARPYVGFGGRPPKGPNPLLVIIFTLWLALMIALVRSIF